MEDQGGISHPEWALGRKDYFTIVICQKFDFHELPRNTNHSLKNLVLFLSYALEKSDMWSFWFLLLGV